MSIIFGIRTTIHDQVTQEELKRMAAATQAFAPDGTFITVGADVGMGYQPFHTTQLSRKESQPLSSAAGNVVVLDGRLDNRAELLVDLEPLDANLTDSALVMATFERWGEAAFAKFVGDWAIALWCKASQTLFLARDHAGTRTLYFEGRSGRLVWSTYLESFFIGCAGRSLDEEYAAAYLCGSSIHDLTPYHGIRAVPPAYYLAFRRDRVTRHRYWHSAPVSEIRYRSEGEYDEHFFSLFKQAVDRRTGIDGPVIAQLSGGMDSTSIVCMSDYIRKTGGCSSPDLLDTISFVSPSEPTWNEEPFIAATEAQRGKTGDHLNISYSEAMFDAPASSTGVHFLPGVNRWSAAFQERIEESMAERNCRVLLSGIGGDELLGGVPSSAPELADYLVSMNLPALWRQTLAWAVSTRTPVLHLLCGAIRLGLAVYRSSVPVPQPPPWIPLRVSRVRSCRSAGSLPLLERFKQRPSALSFDRTWWSIMETLPNLFPGVGSRYEYRYPFLDRDLVDFLSRVPRKEITRPGRRRAMMRRALRDILPVQVVERRRKAFVSRGPIVALQSAWRRIEEMVERPMLSEFGLIDLRILQAHVQRGAARAVQHWPHLLRTLSLELWLQSIGDKLVTPGRTSRSSGRFDELT
jgi:asparagine synthase (glutamine-hydrolysing)